MGLLTVTAGDSVKWSDMYHLARQVDDLARKLKVPGYKRLRDDDTYPFPLEDVYSSLPKNMRIHFDVDSIVGDHMAGSAEVTRQYLSEGQESPWSLPDPTLKKLADAGELYLTTKEDTCWCNAVHKVKPDSANGAMLATADVEEEKRCCWRVNIPEVGENLAAGDSAVINAVAAKFFADGLWLKTDNIDVWYELESCEDGGSMQYFKLTRVEDTGNSYALYRLSACERSITPNFLTWPVLKRYMDRLIKAFFTDTLFQSGGAKMWRLRDPKSSPLPEHAVPPPADFYMAVCSAPPAGGELEPPDVPVNFPLLNPTALPAWTTDTYSYSPLASSAYWTGPGCLPNRARLAHATWCALGQAAAEVPGSATDMRNWPWNKLLFGAVDCDGADAPTVYAATLTQLSKMIDIAEDVTLPRTGLPKTPLCCFDGIGSPGLTKQIMFDVDPLVLTFPACAPVVGTGGSAGLEEYLGTDVSSDGPPLWFIRCPTRDLPRADCGKAYEMAGLVGELPVMLVLIEVRHIGYAALCVTDGLGGCITTHCGAQLVGCTVELNLGDQAEQLTFQDYRVAPAADACTDVIDPGDDSTNSCSLASTEQIGFLDDYNGNVARAKQRVGFIVDSGTALLDLRCVATVTGTNQFAEGSGDCAVTGEFAFPQGGLSFTVHTAAITRKAADAALEAWRNS